MKKILASLVLLLATQVSAETFNRFGASTGVLKGNATSYQTTPAAASDIVSLWGGTCNSSSFLRGDGSCAAEVGLGNVTSVGLTVPTGLSVTGSPITGAGTLAISTTLNGLLRGTGTGFTTAANSDVINLWTGTCNASSFLRGDGSCAPALSGTVPVSSGGTGATTLTGVLKGNGTAAFTAATSSDVISLWSGTCNSGSVLRGDGSCTSAGSGSVTSVGLSMPTGFSVTGSPITGSGTLAVSTTLNGVLRGTGSGFATSTSSNIISLWSGTCNASSFLRGDGSCVIPAAGVSLSGTNTWTGVNTFSPGATAGVAIFNSTAAGGPYVTFQRNGTAFGDVGNGGQMGGGFTTDALALQARTGNPIQFSANASTTPHLSIGTDGVTVSNQQFAVNATSGGAVSRVRTNGTNRGDLCASASASACVVGDAIGDVALRSNGNPIRITADNGATNIAFFSNAGIGIGSGSTPVQVNGTTVQNGAFQKVAHGRVNSSGTLQSGSTGISSASRLGVGLYQIFFNPSFATVPSCSVTAEGFILIGSQTSAPTVSSMHVSMNSGDGAWNDGAFSVICMGS